MSENIEILRNNKLSVDQVDIERSVCVNIEHTSSPLLDTDIKSTIDLNEQYVKERNGCNDYRLILTIKPYCTNVLFNACTEAVMYEGSDDTDAVLYNDDMDSQTLSKIKNKIRGINYGTIGITDMIRNTEYSKDEIGFDYHPGLDIFNNHILRNKTYRIVNDYNGNKQNDREIFNTISDYMRHQDGTVLKRCCRKSITDIAMQDKHLYDKDDILPFYTGEAVTENLREQDGWFGFYNTSVIPAKNKSGVDMDISRVINSKGNCEFVDMYPDRTLFSFVPKYNPYRNRLEYNWDYAITYAYESTTQYYTNQNGDHVVHDFEVIQDGNINAVSTITVEYRKLPNGSNALFFRSATKHNLKPNDKVHIYFNLNEQNGDWRKSNGAYIVSGIGDINHKHEDYYFYVTNMDLLEEIFCTPYLCDIEPQQVNRSWDSWDYVRDNFYAEYTGTDIADERFVEYPDQTAEKYNVGDVISSGWKYYTKSGSVYTENTAAQDIAVTENADFYYKNGGGLTNIPTEADAYIKVKNLTDYQPKKYILFNHDRNIPYNENEYDCESFIEAIINNAFTNNDTYPETNPNDTNNTNTEVNPSMNGLFSDYIAVRFVKTNGNYDCSYYVRKFKQVPDPNIVFGNTVISNSANTTPKGVKWIRYELYNDNDVIQVNDDYYMYDSTTNTYTKYTATSNITVPQNNTQYYKIIEINGTIQPSVDTYNTLYLVPRIGDNGETEYSQYITTKSIVDGNVVYRWEKRAMTLDNETYPLAFSNTIYGDQVAQTTFTDNINVTGLKDNLGRDLSEVFLTIVKSNRGYKKWYNIDNDDSSGDHNIFNDPDIEYSHCFGPVTCGFNLSKQLDDTANIREVRKELRDITTFGPDETIPNDSRYEGFSTKDIEVSDNWFYGDIVEMCPWTCVETTISDVCFRFNTAQREFAENGDDAIFHFDEISSDDYDDDEGFKICTYNVSRIVARKEGYYYKAHYRIPLRDLGPIIQASHPYISVLNATPIQVDDIYILVRTSLKHNLLKEGKVLLRDTKALNTPEWWLDVVHVVDDYSFVMKKIDKDDVNYRDWIAICKGLNNNDYTLRGQNMTIPEKASRLGINTYLWRNTMDIMDITNTESEVNDYIFANNALYVDTCFNFFLKRQDPYNVNGLYFDGSECNITCKYNTCEGVNAIDKWFLGDVQSKSEKQDSNFEYNDVDYEAQC